MQIRDIRENEFDALGQLLIEVYSSLPGFPSPAEQPRYYEMLSRVGSFTEKPGSRVLVASKEGGALTGGVVYFGDMAHGSGGTATQEKNAAGIRLLGVAPQHRQTGIGKALTQACIEAARNSGRSQVILHSTKAMEVAWRLYEKLEFRRSEDLDFMQEQLPVFGFRLSL